MTTGPSIEAWQLSILVTAGIVLVEFGVNALLSGRTHRVPSGRVRTVGLVLLLALTVVVFVAALGPTLADQLSSVAAAVAAVAVLLVTFRLQPPSQDRNSTSARAPTNAAQADQHQAPAGAGDRGDVPAPPDQRRPADTPPQPEPPSSETRLR